MHKSLFLKPLCLFLFVVVLSNCAGNLEPEITVSDAVLRTAETYKVKYLDILEKAKTGDVAAIKELMEFSRFVDETEGINHAQTCLELIPFAKDGNVASACYPLKFSLKKAILERMLTAQTRTKKEDLKKPLQEWASATYTALSIRSIKEIQTDSISKSVKFINIDSLAKANKVVPEAAGKK